MFYAHVPKDDYSPSKEEKAGSDDEEEEAVAYEESILIHILGDDYASYIKLGNSTDP